MANRFGMDFNSGGNGMDTEFGSPGGNNNFAASSPPASQNARKPTEEQKLIPVTIRMILNSNNNMLEDGREPHQVKIVAAIRAVSDNSTAYNYEVEDGTGFIDVKEWLDDSDPLIKAQMRQEAAKEHQYVRIIGKMQVYDDKPSIVAYSVRKLSSGNELTHHFLEVVHSGEKYNKSSQIVGSPNMNGGAMAMNDMNMGGNFNQGGMPSGGAPIAQDSGMGNDQLHADIMTFLEGATDENGGNILDFIQQHQGRHSEDDIRNMFGHLSTEGAIYSTTDENNFARI